MKKSYLTVVLTLASLVALGEGARAQDTTRVVVPFDFVAGGKTLSAGTYFVGHVFTQTNSGFVISNYKDSVELLPIAYEGPTAEHTKLDFKRVGSKYFLNKIGTPDGVYSIGTPQAMTKVAQIKDPIQSTSSGTN
jgi:hypothetical protein